MHSLGKIIITARKLNNIGRWANEFLHLRPSVAEHSFSVTQIAQLLGIIEESNGRAIDWKKLYQKALNHDMPEAIAGDVISTTKNNDPELRKSLEAVETRLVEEGLLEKIKEPYKSIYRNLLFDGKDDSIEGLILTAADNIDALIECVQEIKLSNTDPFLEKYHHILAKIEKIGLYSSGCFVNEILPELIKDSAQLTNKQRVK